LICRRTRDGVQWLARWNKNWQCFFFVAGHRHEGESFYECMVRELREELGIDEGRDYSIRVEDRRNVTFTAFSESSRSETAYTFELYDVAVDDTAWEKVNSARHVRWLGESEIRAGVDEDGKRISPTMGRLLDSMHWQCAGAAADSAHS